MGSSRAGVRSHGLTLIKVTNGFGSTHLEDLFMDAPASPYHWQVTKDFEFKTRATSTKFEHIPVKVERWNENGGRYTWKVKYDHGVTEILDVTDLAERISYSHSLGMKVIP